MRAKWREIKEAGDDRLLQMDWTQAQRWTRGSEQDDADDDWREKKVQQLLKRLVETGIATELGKYPDVAIEAFFRINPDLPSQLVYAAGPDAVDWDQERYHEDPIDVNAMHEF
jgi:hypothetical protein